MNTNDTEHIWLRQTVTYTVDGQTRTLEIGIPMPRNATPQEVEELLRAADAGMSAISRRLDAHIAAAPSGGEAPEAPAVAEAAADRANTAHIPAAPSTSATPPEPAERASANGHSSTTTPAAPNQPPRAPTRPAPAAPMLPADSAPASERPPERPAAPQRPATPPPAQPAPAAPPASESGAEMTRPQFLAATAELGLNPRQAMDRLKVRSLEGLNLREALESLRRQMLGASAHEEPETAGPEPVVAPQPARDAVEDTASRYFEEEDDETIFYSADDDDDEALDDELMAPAGRNASLAASDDLGAAFLDELDEDVDLEDVPDLAPPTPAPRRRAAPAARNAPPARETPAAPPATPAQSAPAMSAAPPTSGARTQAMQLIGRLRAATGGGPASDYQQNAYRNIVENELGKAQATTLVRGLWRTTADRLSAGQLDALIRWGKEEVFAEEAALVLAALRAEQRRAEQTATTTEPATRTTTRGRPAGSAGADGGAR